MSRHRIPQTSQGNFCKWLLLARAFLQAGTPAFHQARILGCKSPKECTARPKVQKAAAGAWLEIDDGLGMQS